MTDQLEQVVDDLRRLADTDVPVEVDHRSVVAEGGRRVRRRRGLVVAAAVVAASVFVAGVATWSGPPDPASEIAQQPTRTPAPTPSSAADPTASPTSPAPALDPDTDLSRAVVQLIDRLSSVRMAGLTFGDLGGRQEVQADVGLDGRAGYVGVVVQRTVDADPCSTPLRPHEARGRTCVVDDDASGRWALITWRDSRQGEVTAVRVVDGGREATVATSTAVPAYDPSVDEEIDPDELPWGSHSQDDAGAVLPPDPPLAERPLDDEQLLVAAREVLTLRLDLGPAG
ncbi:hypothetical protein ABFT23_13970 [Nocardioides sp. C4-1]|uniref:hypothetical protein n=1 Tax=Nocardioides sp. C4-1 TaxID=3151851 RepID=UPI003266DA42